MKAPALVIAVGKGKRPPGGDPGDEPDRDDEAPEDDESAERDAFNSFADAAGIPEDKRDDAYDYLSTMIRLCSQRQEKGDY